MDKKNSIIGILLLAVGLGLMFWQGKNAPETAVEKQRQLIAPERNEASASETVAITAQSDLVLSIPAGSDLADAEEPSEAETVYYLENDYIRISLTNRGGAVREVALKDYPAQLGGVDPFIFNDGTDIPALGLQIVDGDGMPKLFAPSFELLSATDDAIRFRYLTQDGLELVRTYELGIKDAIRDPYVLSHRTEIKNRGSEALALKKLYLSLGAAPPVAGDQMGEFLNFGYYNGEKSEFIQVKDFKGSSGILGFGQKAPKSYVMEEASRLSWVSVKNQFFTAVLTPSTLGQGIFAQPISLDINDDMILDTEGIMGSIAFILPEIKAGESHELGMEYYVGPKEYLRLENLGEDQALIMQFGFFGFISKLLLVMMIKFHEMIPNYGVAIILVTILIKLLLWPLTAAATRSSRRMSKIQEPLKLLREKYKDNPQKIQHETMRLFKENKVNPAAGCLPILVQIPIFLALFWMLRSASELRFASFLWIPDLSMPDTVAQLGPFPLNILPLLMGVTMFFQMRMTPTPTTDAIQAKVFQFMPFIFLFICYSFPAGLVLYWTAQNLITILQQWLTNRKLDAQSAGPGVIDVPSEEINPLIKSKKRKKSKTN